MGSLMLRVVDHSMLQHSDNFGGDCAAGGGVRLMFTLSFSSAFETRGRAQSVGRCAWSFAALVAGLGVPALAQVITYEGVVAPDPSHWERVATSNVERSLDNGWLTQVIEGEELDEYRCNIGGIGGLVGRFFFEWRAITDNPEWLIYKFQVPTVVVAGGNVGVIYHVVMTESAAVLYRDINIPWVVVSFSVDEPHTYRVEVFADEYVWYVDGVVVDSGVPEGPYPDPNARITWGIEGNDDVTATTAWDFVRVGRIPDEASGDYDSDAAVTLIDQYFVADCLTKDGPGIFGGPGNDAGPGCRFADLDADGDVDLLDFAAFQNDFNGL